MNNEGLSSLLFFLYSYFPSKKKYVYSEDIVKRKFCFLSLRRIAWPADRRSMFITMISIFHSCLSGICINSCRGFISLLSILFLFSPLFLPLHPLSFLFSSFLFPSWDHKHHHGKVYNSSNSRRCRPKIIEIRNLVSIKTSNEISNITLRI